MLKDKRVVRAAGASIESAVRVVLAEFLDQTIEEEPDFSSALAARIRDAGRDVKPMGVSLGIKVIRSHGPGTEEKQFGADFGGSLHIDLPGYQVRKGFLAQAKLVRRGDMAAGEVTRLKEQCVKMLKFTEAAYVFLYRRNGVFVSPAREVLAGEFTRMDQLFSTKLSRFYEQHIECFYGDVKLNVPANKLVALLKNDQQIQVRRRVDVSMEG